MARPSRAVQRVRERVESAKDSAREAQQRREQRREERRERIRERFEPVTSRIESIEAEAAATRSEVGQLAEEVGLGAEQRERFSEAVSSAGETTSKFDMDFDADFSEADFLGADPGFDDEGLLSGGKVGDVEGHLSTPEARTELSMDDLAADEDHLLR